jgi:hypothetical protein
MVVLAKSLVHTALPVPHMSNYLLAKSCCGANQGRFMDCRCTVTSVCSGACWVSLCLREAVV